MQLRHKFFIVLFLMSSVPLLILLFGTVEHLESEVTARTNAEMRGTLDKMSGETILILNNQKAIAMGLARVPAIKQFANISNNQNQSSKLSFNHAAELLEQFFISYQLSVPSIQALRFIDQSGKTLIKVKEGKPIPPQQLDSDKQRLYIADQSRRAFFTKAIKEDTKVVMSNFELGQVTSDADFCPAMVRYSVPIKDEVDSLEGVLVVNMWGRRLDQTIETALGVHSGKAYIVELNDSASRDGIYLYHPETDKRFANQVGSNFRLSNELTTDEWEGIRDADIYGQLFRQNGRMLFYKKILPYADSLTQWVLIIETDYDTVYAPINKMRQSIWMLLGVLIFVSFSVAIITSGKLTKPVHNLAILIRRYADGDRTARFRSLSSREDEIDKAGLAFNYLVTTLENTEEERERAVRAACQSERLAAIGQLAAGIGHEINNPLMNVMSLASLVEESLSPDQIAIKNDIELLKKEGKRCANIIQGVLSFAREKEPCLSEFDMAELLKETLELLNHRIESSHMKLEVEIEPQLFMLGDANLLQQVMVNVILNAIQASSTSSALKISASSDHEQIHIRVRDSGVGIKEKDFSKIFDPFFTTKAEGEGTGLGLSLSYGIIKHHKGSLSIKNNPNGGVTVSIDLPIENDDFSHFQIEEELKRVS
jgi:two-component system NtrC family sensor kinase